MLPRLWVSNRLHSPHPSRHRNSTSLQSLPLLALLLHCLRGSLAESFPKLEPFARCHHNSSPALALGSRRPRARSRAKASGEARSNKVEKPAASAPAQLPAQIELLETKIRIRRERNTAARKSMRGVEINGELRVRSRPPQFRLQPRLPIHNFAHVHHTHADGGAANISSAITDSATLPSSTLPLAQDVARQDRPSLASSPATFWNTGSSPPRRTIPLRLISGSTTPSTGRASSLTKYSPSIFPRPARFKFESTRKISQRSRKVRRRSFRPDRLSLAANRKLARKRAGERTHFRKSRCRPDYISGLGQIASRKAWLPTWGPFCHRPPFRPRPLN